MRGLGCRPGANAVLLRSLVSTALIVGAMFMSACAPTTAQYISRVSVADANARAAIQQESRIVTANLPVNSVAVLPLTIRSADTAHLALGYGLSALIATDLARSRQLTVVERMRLDAVMRELDLTKSGRVDTTTAPRVGRIVGARRMILGDVTIQAGGAMQMGSRIADAASGKLDATLTGSSSLNELFDAEKSMVFKIFDALGVPLSPSERRSLERRPTTSLAAFLEYSRGVRSELDRDFTQAVKHYNAAAQLDPGFTEAGDRANTIMGGADVVMGTQSAIDRISSLTIDLVNRPAPVTIGTGTDVGVTSRERLITIIISVGTP